MVELDAAADLAAPALPAPTVVPGAEDEVRNHVYRRTDELLAAGHRRNDEIRTDADLRRRQAELRAWCDEAVGGWPAPRPAPPAVTTSVTERGSYRVEALLLGNADEGHLTATLYRPTGRVPGSATPQESRGAVLFLCGHAFDGKAAAPYQAFCHRLARNGLTVLAVDTVGQGERLSYLDEDGHQLVPHNVQEHTYAGIQCWWTGDTLARHLVDDACRALDFLATVPGVDPDRIGVAGNSGGGTMSTWLMMGEPRIAAAAVGSFIMSRHSYLWTDDAQDPEQVLPGGAVAGIDHEDFLLAMAPRPTLVMSAQRDFFPIDGARWSVARARRYYDLIGAADHLVQVEVDAGHGLHPVLARAAAEFFVRHLGDGRPVDHTEPDLLPASSLQATVSGQVRIDHPDTPLVFERNLRRHRHARSCRSRTGAEAAAAWLAERVRGPHRDVPPFRPEWGPEVAWAAGATVRPATWETERGVRVAAQVIRPAEVAGPTVVALADHGSEYRDALSDHCSRWVSDGRPVVALDVRGVGAVRMRPINDFPYEGTYGTAYKLLTDLIWMSDSLAAARVHDVVRTIENLDLLGAGSGPVHLYGNGHGAFHGLLAATISPQVRHLELDGPVFDPDVVVSTRLYPAGRDQQLVIPGMAVRAPIPDLFDVLAGRGVVVARR